MNKLIGIFLAVLLIIGAVIIFFSLRNGGLFGSGPKVTIGEEVLNVKIADTPEKRAVGLSETASLGENEGMLFLFDEEQYPAFWMKGMEFPIDIIFLDEKTVVTIYQDVQPPKDENGQLPLYQPTRPANRVLEVPAGFVKAHNLKVGDTVSVEL